ncbi:MAG: hypothetical protein WCO51_13300, partial [bacterium]
MNNLQLGNGIEMILGLVDAPCCHPNTLEALGDDELDTIIVKMHEAKETQLWESADPSRLAGVGQVLYVGFDSEWKECRGDSGQMLNVLSYQFYVVGVGGEMSFVFFPKSGLIDDRLALRVMLSELLWEALKHGVILDYPAHLVLVGFFLRADLAMLADLITFKHQLNNIGGKIATAFKAVDMELGCARQEFNHLDSGRMITCSGKGLDAYQVKLSFYDIAKH